MFVLFSPKNPQKNTQPGEIVTTILKGQNVTE